MFKKIALLGILLSATSAFTAPRIVVWDIHQVLCTQPKNHGYQCSPQEDTFALVRELHQKGVKQVILSNISRRSLAILCKHYPEYFSYFDMSQSLADTHFIFTRKPHGKYYKMFLKLHRGSNPQDMIFFDDKIENVKGAQTYGIDGQLFCTAEQARTILKQKGLL